MTVSKADYNRYNTAKSLGDLDYPWRQSIEKDIKDGNFKSFTSANSTAKQFVIVTLDRANINCKVTNLGCGVHKIEVIV